MYKDMKTKLKESRSDVRPNVRNSSLTPPKIPDIRRSAPSSPTFNRVRQLSNADQIVHSSTMNKSDIHSFNTSYSPATSPSNSSSSSDMNILSELAGHTLFRKGLVRNLNLNFFCLLLFAFMFYIISVVFFDFYHLY